MSFIKSALAASRLDSTSAPQLQQSGAGRETTNTPERTPLLQSQASVSRRTLGLLETMEKVKGSKVARFFDKLAVESEPGLTNAQV